MMIANWLVILGLAVVPFYEILVTLLVPNTTTLRFVDTRVPKDFLVMGLSLSLIFYVLNTRGFRPLGNKLLCLFLGFIFFSIHRAPKISIVFLDNELGGMWDYTAYFKYIIFFLLFLSIANLEWNIKWRVLFLNTILYVGTISSIYACFQFWGIDQFFLIKPPEVIGYTESAGIVANLGQPTILGGFLTLCIPIAIYLKKWPHTILMLLVVALTKTNAAIIAVFVTMMFLLLTNRNIDLKKRICAILAVVIFIPSVCILSMNRDDKLISDNGRFIVWKNVFKDIKSSESFDKFRQSYAFTGYGAGSYDLLSHTFNKDNFKQAHNEPLNILFTLGYGGFILYLLFCGDLFKKIYLYVSDPFIKALFCCIISIFIVSIFSFPFQLAITQFYTVVILGVIFAHIHNLRETNA